MATESAKKQAQNKINLSKGKQFKSGDPATKRAGSKGGKKTAEVQRRRRNMREDVKSILSMPLTDAELENLDELKAISELKGSNITAQEAMIYQLIARAIKKGDREAIRLIYEMSGDNREEVNDNDAVLRFIRSLAE